MRTTSDFSYYNRRLVGERLLRVGDAAGFMDPIFSAGVFLAMWSGKLAAEAVVAIAPTRQTWRTRVRAIMTSASARAEVLLAHGGEFLHDAVHGIVSAPRRTF